MKGLISISDKINMIEMPTCNRCNNSIFWFESKAGKFYPTNTNDPKDFHKCQESKGLEKHVNPLTSFDVQKILEDTLAYHLREINNKFDNILFQLGGLKNDISSKNNNQK